MPLNEHIVTFEVGAERLHGMLHLPTSSQPGPHPCVLMLHGFTGTSIEPHRLFVLMARAFASAGIAAMRFDFRGSGQSEGVFSDMTLTRELEDALSALRLLEGRGDIDRSRTGILGLSMGGLMAALTAGTVSVKALALWAPATPAVMLGHFAGERRNPAAIAGAFAAGFPGQEFPAGMRFDAPSGHMDMGGNPVSSAFFIDALNHDSLETVQNHAGPALIVHGTADPTVPFAVGQQYAAALGTRAALHAIDGAGHTFESVPHHNEALEVTLEFFQRSL